jgi:pilus assembly protein FimV
MARALRALLATLLLFPASLWAIGLGDMEVSSKLNQRFVATIAIVGASADQLADAEASLADTEAFQRAGLDRHYILTTLRFETIVGDDGAGYLRITSTKSIREPGLSFIIELKWRQGLIRRQYSVLLETN